MSFLGKLFGIKDANLKVVAKIQPMVDQVNQLEAEFQALTDEELRNKTEEFRKNLKEFEKNSKELNKEKEALEQILPVAFAAVREANRRAIKIRHFDVQLVGGVVLHRGEIAEMKTGEGKTHVAALALYLNALAGKGAHLITVNDYLAKRDAAWNGPANHLLGMKTACIIHNVALVYDPEYAAENQSDEKLKHMRPCQRKEAYEADITYGTNSEFGFDYLRDNMASTTADQVQRPLYYAIVDEVDSVLIDEARTPLIISAPAEESADLYTKFAQIVPRLKENVDYNVDEKMRAATLSEAGLNNIEKILGLGNIYNEGGIQMVHHLEQALNAHALYKRDKDYVVQNDEVIIIDEFTGRLMQGRRYSEGLHQAIEAKEGVSVQKESRTLATITIQNYFRLYKKLAGMTGTAVTEAEEFSKIYNLDVTVVPTNKPVSRQDLSDRIYATERGKFMAVAREIKKLHDKGQPVLVGTISIERNELLSALLQKEGVAHQVLNAKQHEKEAQVIAQAGRSGAVTVATNMAGRGVDIKLGGEPFNQAEYEKVKTAGGLFILGTERHESRRIDNQLRGRAGRQGDPGQSQFYISMEDDLMRVFGSDRVKGMMQKMGMAEDQSIENGFISRAIE
ncbi:preprotein translocase subunit SecA, partial [Candidatus Falkowbacteria bacterium RIFOXYC2_FULL_48_21]